VICDAQKKKSFQNKKVILWLCYSAQNLGYDAQKFGYDFYIDVFFNFVLLDLLIICKSPEDDTTISKD